MMKAMVLAAGEGTRLRPLTLALPKPMVPVANVPLLERTVRLLAAHGIRDIAVNLYHHPEAIRAALGDGSALGVRLHYSDEETLMGTAGGVKRMESFLDETFLVLYGDNLYQADFAPLIRFHQDKKTLATIATFTTPNPTACGLVVTDEAGRVTRFQEKPPPEEVFTDQANAGVYVLEPEVLRHIPPDTPFDFGRDVFPALLADRGAGILYALPLSGYLQDTGTIPNYFQANWDILEGRTGVPPEGTNGLLIGEGVRRLPHPYFSVRRSPHAYFSGRNIIGKGVGIGKGSSLRESIIWDGCQIGAVADIQGAILGRGVCVGYKAVIGEGAILADGVVVKDGATVPEGARIAPGETVS